jgi:hypothetical protein
MIETEGLWQKALSYSEYFLEEPTTKNSRYDCWLSEQIQSWYLPTVTKVYIQTCYYALWWQSILTFVIQPYISTILSAG